MSRSTLLVVLVGLLVAVAGCGDAAGGSAAGSTSSGAATPSSTPAPGCLRTTDARADVAIRRPRVVTTYAIGTSQDVVIASNQSDEDLCSWVPFAKRLAADGFRVVLYDYGLWDVRGLEQVIRFERAKGARSVSLLGASEGAKTSIVTAARTHSPLAAVVSLSAETDLHGIEIAHAAKRLHTPTLYVTARDDLYGAADAARTFDRVTKAPHDLVVVPGDPHGTALLHRTKVRRQVVSFLKSHLPG